MVQDIYIAGDDDKLYTVLKPHIERQARIHSRVNGSPYTCYADYLSRFWEETWQLVQQPYRSTGYLFVDTLDLAFKRRAVDVVRELTPHWPKQYGSNEEEADLRVWTDYKTDQQMDRYSDKTSDVESAVLNWLLVQQILSDPCLTDKDRRLLQLMYEHPHATYEELGEMMGVKRQTVHEQMIRIRKKLEKYRDDALYGLNEREVHYEKSV